MPKRIQRRRTAGWRMPEGATYVGRPSRWGNPWRIDGGTLIGPPWSLAREAWHHIPASECMAAYIISSDMGPAYPFRAYRDLLRIRARDEGERLHDWLVPLIGRDLACWCNPFDLCHADVLLRLAAGKGV